jgi:hypothetical protein
VRRGKKFSTADEEKSRGGAASGSVTEEDGVDAEREGVIDPLW